MQKIGGFFRISGGFAGFVRFLSLRRNGDLFECGERTAAEIVQRGDGIPQIFAEIEREIIRGKHVGRTAEFCEILRGGGGADRIDRL